jgi:N-acetyl-anhydromuramyl-L-alanine amidase AmpD
MLGFTIKTDGEGKRYEVVVASDVALFKFDAKPKRTTGNFYSSRGAGLQPAERGEAVYVLPPEVLARFVGKEKLYYALATYPNGKTSAPEITNLPSEGSAYVNLRGLTGRSLKRVRVLPSRQRAAAGYSNPSGSELEWAGDTAAPGTQPVVAPPQASVPAGKTPDAAAGAKAAALAYNDGFGPLPLQVDPPSTVPSARAQSNESFSVNWDDVEPIAQPTDVSCWAASGAMVVGWRDRVSLTPETIAKIAGQTTATGLDPAQVGQFARDLGLVSELPKCYTIDGFRDVLEQSGPLWVAADVPGLHAIVVTGMYGDGAADGSDTYLRITDPWDRVTGSPGAPGSYLHTHNTGSRYILSWASFTAEYEGAASMQGVNLQILHSPNTGGRTARHSGAAGYAMSSAAAPQRRAAALVGGSFTVNWDELELNPQPTENSCWATAGAMVIGWRDRVSITPEKVAEIAGRTVAKGIYPEDRKQFATDVGLSFEAPASYSIDGFRRLLENYGPLWVGVLLPGSGHAIVVNGMYSDGAADGSGTFVRISDPWDRVVGSPGAAGSYLSTHDSGSRYILNWADFTSEYEQRATSASDGTVNIQILHAAGTDGRQPNRTGAAGYAMGVAAAMDESSDDDSRGIDGPVPYDIAEASAQAYARPLAITPEYPQASRFEPASTKNYRVSASPRTIKRVVIHITDGGSKINGTIGWFQNPKAGVSAHYIVGQNGEVVQMVHHNDVAWHAHTANGDSIGIEHVANTKGLMPTDAQYCASAALTNWLCTTYGISIDRTHVLGHSEADPKTTHSDCPNAVWDWDYYMDMVTTGSCHPRAQAEGLSSESGGQAVMLPPAPMDVGRSLAADAVPNPIEKGANREGNITWELEQFRGWKHPNDTAPASPPPFHDAPAIRLDDWPYVDVPDRGRVSASFNVRWQCNGQSLGDVQIVNTGTCGGQPDGLRVTAKIDDDIVSLRKTPAYAALRVHLQYEFARGSMPPSVATIDLHLYGDGTYEQTSRWEQS